MPRIRGDEFEDSQAVALDDVLRLAKVIGWRRWGMVVLYYRAGLKQYEIGRIFGVRRQIVAYELRRAFEIVAHHAKVQRLCDGGRSARRGPSTTVRTPSNET